MIVNVIASLNRSNIGYIAGANDGIVTALGKPASKNIYLFDAKNLVLLRVLQSLNNGHYLISDIDPNEEYLVMVRDYKRELEPFAWDYVKPADDLTIDEQQALWATWQ